jgi:hypothetical protein
MKKLALKLKIFIFRNFKTETVSLTVSETYTTRMLKCDIVSLLLKRIGIYLP